MNLSGTVAVDISVGHENTVSCPLAIGRVVATSGQRGPASLRILLIQPSAKAGVEHQLSTLAGASVIANGCNDIMLRVVGRVDDGKLLGHGWDALWTGLAWFALPQCHCWLSPHRARFI